MEHFPIFLKHGQMDGSCDKNMNENIEINVD